MPDEPIYRDGPDADEDRYSPRGGGRGRAAGNERAGAENPWDARAWLKSHPSRPSRGEGTDAFDDGEEPAAERPARRRDYRPNASSRKGIAQGGAARGDYRRDDRDDRDGRDAGRGSWRKNARDYRGASERSAGVRGRDYDDDRDWDERPQQRAGRDLDDRGYRKGYRNDGDRRDDRPYDRHRDGGRDRYEDRDWEDRDDRSDRDDRDSRYERDGRRWDDDRRAPGRQDRRDYDDDYDGYAGDDDRGGFDGYGDPYSRRVANPCPVAKRCGGCEWLAMPYEEQLERKQELIEDLFGDYKCGVEGIMGMNSPQRYRNKVQLPFAPGHPNREGRITPRWGIFERGSHHIVPCDDCIVEDGRARPIIADVADLMPRYNIHAYDERTGDGWLRYCLVRTALMTDEVMLTLVATSKRIPAEKAFVNALLERHPEITTIVVNVNKERTSVILGKEERVVTGPGFIVDELCGCRFRISSSSFYQTNPIAAQALYEMAVDLADLKPGDRIGDAYCGTGTIGIVAAKKSGAKLLGVERNPDAVDDARENARLNDIEDAEFVVGDAGSVFARMARAGESLDVVFMDPPRAGATQAFLANLCRLSPTRVVYISCEPKTQRHDIAALLRNGYRIKRICPVDMFPHTDHVENIVLLERPLSQKGREAERLRLKKERMGGAQAVDHSWLNADETTSYERGLDGDEGFDESPEGVPEDAPVHDWADYGETGLPGDDLGPEHDQAEKPFEADGYLDSHEGL